MNRKKIILLLGLLILNFLWGFKILAAENLGVKSHLTIEDMYLKSPSYSLDYKRLKSLQKEYSKNVKGIYINFWTLSHPKKRKRIIKAINESSLNSIVIDLKDINGYTPFASAPLKEFSYNLNSQELKTLISNWQKQGIYVIGRIAVFKDGALALQNSNYALKYIIDAGEKFSIIDSTKWTNPYSEEVWNYNINIAQEMAGLGLDEIQFDYIRFPTLSNNSKLVFRADPRLSRVEAIVSFLKKAKQDLDRYNIIISADLFGLTTTANDDLGIGQDIKKIAKEVDYISPMLYPSHYSEGIYGIKDPAANPYQIIYNSLTDAQEKLGANTKKIRPWLQDFSIYHIYSQKEIKAQIKAVEDKNISSWLLWNPKCIYTIEALMPERKEINNES
ncbi:putative glycoside hydrolase [Halanaerobacter jeridensis]|uniref:DUF4015 domain-containing protein n=1 Tax=Halanaerobacter jeridensis TaxID=706427 RepID=A0A938XSS3_9FIRM|nr:putative glycoside hydrolase [Halanaerobacter jeridensis]MBM7557159.1 hypothetical protein [Halanaerobacter jeridensis]